MTAATLIEIGTAGCARPGQSEVPARGLDKAQSAPLAGSAVAGHSAAAVSDSAGFVSKWQSVLAPLVIEMNELNEDAVKTEDSHAAGLESLEINARSVSSAKTDPLGAVLPQKVGANLVRMKQGIGLAIAGPPRPPASSGAGATGAKGRTGANQQPAAGLTTKSVGHPNPGESRAVTEPARTYKSAKLQVVSPEIAPTPAATLPGTIPMEALAQVTEHPLASVPVVSVNAVPQQPSLPDTATNFVDCVSGNFIQPAQSNAEVPGLAASWTGRAVGQATEIKPPAKSAVCDDSPAQNLLGVRADSPPSGAREIPSTAGGLTAPRDTQDQAGKPFQTATQGQNPIQSELPGQPLKTGKATATTPSQVPVPPPVPDGDIPDPSGQPLAMTANAEKPNSGASAQSSIQAMPQLIRAASSVQSARQENPLPSEQTGSAVLDGVASRSLASTPISENAAVDSADPPKVTATSVGSREILAAPSGTQPVETGAESPGLAASSPASSPQEATPLLSSPGLSSGARILVQSAARAARANAASELLPQKNHFASGQVQGPAAVSHASAGLAGDEASRLLDSTSTPGTVSPAAATARGQASMRAGSGSRETFAALDAETAVGVPTWIHAGARRAEAGFSDPALGWVSVRADASGAGIHAALVPGSTEAAQVLGGHLEGLNAYLAEHNTTVETLTLTAPESRHADSGTGMSDGQDRHPGSGQATG